MKLEESYKQCLEITRAHYENFPVASFLIPSGFRKHIAAIYAFARTADDFSDELKDKEKLLDWRYQLYRCLEGEFSNPIFQALADTITKFQLPVEWLDNLLTAFLMDLDKNRFLNFDELLHYCQFSANPVGRIILWMFGYRSEDLMKKSDRITTALQLTNFWQDLSVDLEKNRLYIPLDILHRFQLIEEDIFQHRFSVKFALVLSELIKKTKLLYSKGSPLLNQVTGRLKYELSLTMAGGKEILKKVHKNPEKILYYRPTLSKRDWVQLAFSSLTVYFND
jgi:squalene synthase HpnC